MWETRVNLLGRISPWIPTAIFIGPPFRVAALSIGPVAFRLGLGVYAATTTILTFQALEGLE
jgi:hypothetical protein